MKRYLTVVLLAALLPVFSLNTGCGTVGRAKQEQIAFTSLSAVATSVDAALKAYAEVYNQGKVRPEIHARIESAHNKYRMSMDLAISIAQLDINAPASNALVDVANELIVLIMEVL